MTSPTAAPSPGTAACALRRIVGWSKNWPAAFWAIAISAVRPWPDDSSVRATLSANTNAAHPPLLRSSTQDGRMPSRCAMPPPWP